MLTTAILLVCASVPASADAASQRVPADYYGVAYSRIGADTAAMRDQQLAAIARLGLRDVRITIPWYSVEPDPPGPLGHSYDFSFADALVRAIARHGLRPQVTFAYTPTWASGADAGDTTYCRLLNVTSLAPGPLHHYAAAIGEMVGRYGRAGSFWAANSELPQRPVTTWEVWNEPNLKGYWCPTPSPERYAEMFVMAARQVERADPNATILTAGMPLASPSNRYIDFESFLRRGLAHRPNMLERADAVGIHVYPHGDLHEQLRGIVRFRDHAQEAAVPNSMPLAITEIGWSIGGQDPLTEAERAKRFALVTHQLPRVNCNISSMVVHAWTTLESNRNERQQWYGIARPADGNPYPSALEFAASSALMLGALSSEPPTRALTPCDGMKALDRDGGGVPDHRDYFPLDPARSQGPGGWGSDAEDKRLGGGPGDGGAGNGSSGAGACTITGDRRANVLRGTPGRDVICGRGGGDVIIGRGGHDFIRAGRGGDLVHAGSRRDQVSGGAGRDVIAGATGRDKLRGGPGRDTLLGGPGKDVLRGGPGRDVLRQAGRLRVPRG